MTEPTPSASPTIIETAVEKNAPWEVYQRPYVRDLAYALACPNVLTEWLDLAPLENTGAIAVHNAKFWASQYDAYRERLNELDTTTDYQDLTRYLLTRPSPNRLGFHFEGLLSFWLTDGFARGLHSYEMLASNVQLFCGKQTSGELDLILYNHEEKLTEHWELAIKFFMGSAPFAPVNWVGINSKDNLQRKMTHMQTKQFRTVFVDTENHGQVKIDKRYAVIKGRFFLPITTSYFGCTDSYPEWLEPSFPVHCWLAASNSQNNLVIKEISNQDKKPIKHSTGSIDVIAEPLTSIKDIRRAHYIEWFTQRDCYNSEYRKNSNNKIPPTLANLEQGLYFIQKASQERYIPLIILQTHINVG